MEGIRYAGRAQLRKLFLSSTWVDLREARQVAVEAINRLDRVHFIGMENYGARDQAPIEHCLEKVRESDVFIGVVGHRYGSCPPGSEVSFTELEYNEACANRKPRLIFLFEGPIDAAHVDSDAARQKQNAFRNRVKQEALVATFKTMQELGAFMVTALFNLILREELKGGEKSVLLFPFVTSVSDGRVTFNTGLAISNPGRAPGDKDVRAGIVMLYFYGEQGGKRIVIEQRTSRALVAGGTMTMSLLYGGPDYGIHAVEGFQGYVYAICHFPGARGFAQISDAENRLTASGYLAEKIENAQGL